MKTFTDKQKNYILKLISLILLCEILLKTGNRIIQTIGICLTPIIIVYELLVFKSDKKMN